PPDGRRDEGHGRQGQGRRHDARGHGRPCLEDGAWWPRGRYDAGNGGRLARPVEDGSETARGAAEAGGGGRPRQGRRRSSGPSGRRVAGIGWPSRASAQEMNEETTAMADESGMEKAKAELAGYRA